MTCNYFFFFFQAEDGIRDKLVTGVQTCALPILETLGVILYQDQVLQVCQALSGFTPGQAEALRRAMSRRRSRELMAGFWDEFREGAAARGVPEPVAERVFTQVIAFSEFGFPKSHAAAFGLLAYQSAWLRHYHPE